MFMNQLKDEKEVASSSDEEPYDSDQINSDIEAELYSVIHYETTISTANREDFLNTSDKQNNSTSSKCSGLIRNYNELLNNSNLNSACIQIVEAADKFSTDGQSLDFNLQQLNKSRENLKRISLDLENAQPFHKKLKDSNSPILNEASPISSEEDDDNDIVRLNLSNKQLSSSDDNDIVYLNLSNKQLSSDDDNDIICIEPSNKQQSFKTNVCIPIAITDYDTDSADSWCFKSRFHTPSSNISKKDLWFVNDEDLFRSRRSSSRYHESESTICNCCKQKGHSSKFCSFSKESKCFICGDKHNSHRCKKRICAKCLGMGHDIKYCVKEIQFCNMCNMPGHYHKMCPELWRKFQRTNKGTKDVQIWRLNQDTPFFCYNCGSSQHFGPFCKGPRMNALTFPTWPYPLNFKVKSSVTKPRMSFNANEQQMQSPKQKRKRVRYKKHNNKGVSPLEREKGAKKHNDESVIDTETNNVDKSPRIRAKVKMLRMTRREKQRANRRLKKSSI